jgi:hypothetical protein
MNSLKTMMQARKRSSVFLATFNHRSFLLLMTTVSPNSPLPPMP